MSNIKIEAFIDATSQESFELFRQLRILTKNKPELQVSFKMAVTDIPTKPILNRFKAIKAAQALGGETLMWDVIDAIGKGSSDELDDLSQLFVLLKKVIPHFDRWLLNYHDENVIAAVHNEMQQAKTHRIDQLPALLLDDYIVLTDIRDLKPLYDYLGNYEQPVQTKIKPQNNTAKRLNILPLPFDSGEDKANACVMVDGKWKCN